MFSRSKMILILLVLATVLLSVSAVAAQEIDPPFVTTVQPVNIRSGPGTEYLVRGVMNTGVFLPATGRNAFAPEVQCLDRPIDAEMWFRVQFNEIEGWVNRCVVVFEGDIDVLPVVNVPSDGVFVNDEGYPIAAIEGPNDAPFGEIFIESYTNENAALRDVPSLRTPIVGDIPAGELVFIVGRSEPAGWVELVYNGVRGWAAGHLFILDEGWESIVPVTGTAAPSGEAPVTFLGVSFIEGERCIRLDANGAVVCGPRFR